MANPLTNQSGGGIPPRPEAPAAVVEQRPSSPTSPAGEPRRPALTAANLDLLEDHHTADTIELDQVSSVATMFMLLGPDKFSVKEGTLKTIADRAQERLTADGTDLAGLTGGQLFKQLFDQRGQTLSTHRIGVGPDAARRTQKPQQGRGLVALPQREFEARRRLGEAVRESAEVTL